LCFASHILEQTVVRSFAESRLLQWRASRVLRKYEIERAVAPQSELSFNAAINFESDSRSRRSIEKFY
jgi:hypothetical protein